MRNRLPRAGTRLLPTLALVAACAACAPTMENPDSVPMAAPRPAVTSVPLRPAPEPVTIQVGNASYYADSFAGRRTASGERYRRDELTAASNLLPLGAVVTVVNRENGLSVEVRVNDRLAPHNRRAIVDLSKSAARKIGLVRAGVATVEVKALPSRQPTPELAAAVRKLALARD